MSENAESGDGSDIFGYYGDSEWEDDEYYDSDDCWLEVDESVIGTFDDVDDLEYADVYVDVALDEDVFIIDLDDGFRRNLQKSIGERSKKTRWLNICSEGGGYDNAGFASDDWKPFDVDDDFRPDPKHKHGGPHQGSHGSNGDWLYYDDYPDGYVFDDFDFDYS